jgi:hypothetical protein
VEEPGGLRDLGTAGRAAWGSAIRSRFDSVQRAPGEHPFLLVEPDEGTPERTGCGWTGLPSRVVSCLGRRRALNVLDGEPRLQEEYLEWRSIRDEDGLLRRVELTTELRDYWRVLAAREPERTLELVGELTGRRVESEEVYGGPVPAAPESREEAFVATMIRASNPLNDGRAGILFMRHRDNSLRALFKIAAAAASPCVLNDDVTGRSRCATAFETIPLLEEAAIAGRASDPVIVERLGRLAFEGRRIAFDNPLGLYMEGVEHTRLRTPDDGEVPSEWFVASRGLTAEESADGHPRTQRLVVEVPGDCGFSLGELRDVTTERTLQHGGQVAELTQVRLLLRASGAGMVRSETGLEFDPDRPRADPCDDIFRIVAPNGRPG